MFVSIFGELEYGNRAALLDWIAAHAQAHRQIRQVISQAGAQLAATPLNSSTIDNDWFGIHGLAHVAIARSIPTISTESTALVDTNTRDWSSDGRFYNWHQNHDLLHQRINAALNITA